MNRREFLAAGFKLGAAGLLLPVIEPVRKYWSLDRTMLPAPYTSIRMGGFHYDDNANEWVTEWVVSSYVETASPIIARAGDIITVGIEPMLVTQAVSPTKFVVLRS